MRQLPKKNVNGYKTHLTALVTIGLLVCQWAGWLTIPPEVYAALMALALMFLRSGVASAAAAPEAKPKPGTREIYPPVGLGLLLLLTPALLLTPGCATQNASGRILATSVQTVDAAMQGWWTHELLNHPPQSQVDQVRAAYAAWQLAETAAESAYVAAARSGDQSVWNQAAAALTASQAALLALVNQLTTAPNAP